MNIFQKTKNNNMVLGLDISTSKIGICVTYENTILCELTALNIDSKFYRDVNQEHRFIEKAKAFKTKMVELRDKYNKIAKERNNNEWSIRHVWVEAPLKNNNQNINTVTMLYEFNGVCCYILSEVFGFNPNRVGEQHARKEFLPEFVREEIDRVENPDFKKLLKKKSKGKLLYKPPKECNTPTKKYKYLKEKFKDVDFPDPLISKSIEKFSYPDDIVIKEYIFNKFQEKYQNTEISKKLVWDYDRNGNLRDINFDKTDAWVVAEYGAKQILKK